MTGTFQPNVGKIIWLSNQPNRKFETSSSTSNLGNFNNNFQLRNRTSQEVSTAFTPWRSSSTTTSALTQQSKSESISNKTPNSWNQKPLSYQQATMPGTTMASNTGPHFTTSMGTTSTTSPYYMSQHSQMRPGSYAPLYNGKCQAQTYAYPQNVQKSSAISTIDFIPPTTAERERGIVNAEPAFQSYENILNTKTTKSSNSHVVSSPLNKTHQNYTHDSSFLPEKSKKDIKPAEVNLSGSLTPKKVPKLSVDLFASQKTENTSLKTDNSTNNPSQKCSKNTEISDFCKNSSSNFQSEDNPLMFPAHFMKGSIIQLARGQLKRVEDMRTEDFIECTKMSADLKIDSSTVIKIVEKEHTASLNFSVGEQRIQITVEAAYEHPFYVFGQGWSSCSPTRTMKRYGLPCNQLAVGDVCISLTHKSDEFSPAANGTQSNPPSKDDKDVKIMSERSVKSKSAPIHDQKKHNSESFCKKRRWSAPEDMDDI